MQKLLKQFSRCFPPGTHPIQLDPLGNLLADITPHTEGKPYLLLHAPLAQAEMVVTYIDAAGFIHPAASGSIDSRVLLAQEVTIHGKRPVSGLIATRPPHLEQEADRKQVPPIENLLIDIGMTKREAETVIAPGDPITINGEWLQLANHRVSAPCLNSHAGVAVLLRTLALLQGKNDRCGLGILFSIQKQLHARGAVTGSFTMNPDLAICIDTGCGRTAGIEAHRAGELGKGSMIGISPVLSRQISSQLQKIAEENHIPYQLDVKGGLTATAADVIGTSRNGVQTGLLSVPLLYMHTPVETIDLLDVENTAKLLAAWICSL